MLRNALFASCDIWDTDWNKEIRDNCSMRKFRDAVLSAGVAVLVCFAVMAAHVWQAHGSGIAHARHHASSLLIAD